MNRFAVIMAGGKGERFWPASREMRPKQMLSLFSDKTMIEETVLRVQTLVPGENILILTNANCVEPMRKLLPMLPAQNIIGEPARRDTAPCIALAAGIIAARDPEGMMMVFPADHIISGIASFQADLEIASNEGKNALVTIGIPPTYGCSDYGYIEAAAKEKISPVRRFVEKPDPAKAEKMVQAGSFFWNAGIFVWSVALLRSEFTRHAPAFAGFMDAVSEHWGKSDWHEFLNTEFAAQQKISIDYALMEKSTCIKVVSASFDWDDVGNWSALRNHKTADENRNVLLGNCRILDCQNDIIINQNQDHLVAAIDLENLVVVHSGNVTLVLPEKSLSKMKKLLSTIQDPDEQNLFL